MRRYRHGWTLVTLCALIFGLAACSATPTVSPATVTSTPPPATPPTATTGALNPAAITVATPGNTATPIPALLTPIAASTRAITPIAPTTVPNVVSPTPTAGATMLLVTNFGGKHLSWVDPLPQVPHTTKPASCVRQVARARSPKG